MNRKLEIACYVTTGILTILSFILFGVGEYLETHKQVVEGLAYDIGAIMTFLAGLLTSLIALIKKQYDEYKHKFNIR